MNSRAWRGKNLASPTKKAYITTKKARKRGSGACRVGRRKVCLRWLHPLKLRRGATIDG
jgi:hypothetical protein